MFPGKEDIQNLDVAEDSEDELGVKFEDRDWENHISYVSNNNRLRDRLSYIELDA